MYHILLASVCLSLQALLIALPAHASEPYQSVNSVALGSEISRDVRLMRDKPWSGLKSFYMSNELRQVVNLDVETEARSYWGIESPAAAFVEGALDHFWEARGISDASAQQSLVVDSIVFLGLLPYQLLLLERATGSCFNSSIPDGIKNWKLSWAYYIGDGQTSELLHGRADRTAGQFLQLNDTRPVALNDDMKRLYKDGEEAMKQGHCEKVRSIVLDVRRNSAAALIQVTVGASRLLFKERREKARATAWAAAVALLPSIHECDSETAKSVRRILQPVRSSRVGIRPEEYERVMKNLESALECFELSCQDVGSLVSGHFCEQQRPATQDRTRDSLGNVSSTLGILAIVLGSIMLLLIPGVIFGINASHAVRRNTLDEGERKSKLPIIDLVDRVDTLPAHDALVAGSRQYSR